MFLEQLPQIERALDMTCRRNATYGDDADEFAAHAKLRLVENDYEILRRFEGRSKVSTYLTTVVVNLFRDWRISRWGKWRPSAAARRLGTTAIALETLHYRDGLTVGEALDTMRQNAGIEISDEEGEELLGRLPRRVGRHFVSDDALDQHPSGADTLEEARGAEHELLLHEAERSLASAFDTLGAVDRFILKAIYFEGLSMVQVAQLLQMEAKALYPRKDRALRDLRRALEADGLRWDELSDALGWKQFDLPLTLVSDSSEPPAAGGGRGRPDRGETPDGETPPSEEA